MQIGHVEYITIESEALKDNRLHDPHVRQLAVYLPPGYNDAQNKKSYYPSLYLLSSHGRTSHYYLSWQQWDENIQERLNRLISSHAMPPVIVVMPDCWTRVGGSQFLDSAIGNYATYLTEEIIPTVDKTFRTQSQREHRGVFGHSSGGYGALVHAMQNPDLFGGVASRAPDLYWEYTALPNIAHLPGQMAKWGGFEEFITGIPTIKPKRSDFWKAIHTLMQCMAYAPNPDSSLGFDSPIDPETGALISEVWERWLQHDPVRMIDNEAYQNALRQMKVLFLEVGSYDEYQLQVGARIFHKKLEDYQIVHQYEEFPDGHSSTSYRYDLSLPILAAALDE